MILNNILSSEFSFSWLLIIVVFSFALSFLLYWKDKFLNEINKSIRYFLLTLRFVSIFLIAFFLIKPLINNVKKDFFKAKLLVLQDNSESIILNKDSLFYKTELHEQYNKLYNELENKNIDYSIYRFSDSLSLSSNFKFDKKTSNISEALSQALDLNIENNIGGILLLSDGINNKGQDPYYFSKNVQVPIYTVGLGDTSLNSDLKIDQIQLNKIGFTNQKIPFSIDISTLNIDKSSVKLSIYENKNVLFQKDINLKSGNDYKTVEGLISQLPVGIHKLDFELPELKTEYNIKNNKQSVYINIVESKQKILLLSSAPHPDIAAIKSVLSKQKNYEFESSNIRDFKGQIGDYNLVILYQLPTIKDKCKSIITEINQKHIPTLTFISDQTDFTSLNTIKSGIPISKKLNKNDLIEQLANPSFTLFKQSKDLLNFFDKVPPLIAPMIKVYHKSNVYGLTFQNIKNVKTNQLSIFFTETENNKLAYILGEGIWRWKIYDYQKNQSFSNFNEFLVKTVQYLSIKTPKDNFIVDIKNRFEEYEPVQINVQLYNKSLELIQDQEISIKYFDSEGHEFNNILSPNSTAYSSNLGLLKPGIYHYEISTILDQKKMVKMGQFVVSPSFLEYKNLTANHQLLKSISKNTNAIYFEKENWLSVVDSIEQNPHFKTKVYSSDELTDLIHFKWILLLIVFLLSIEWFIRKFSGTI